MPYWTPESNCSNRLMAETIGKKDSPRSRESWEQLFAEATQVQGVSLGRDAWRRLRRNHTAMVAMGFLIVLASSSFLGPLLPLQSPQAQYPEERAFLAPNFEPFRLLVVDGDPSVDNTLLTKRENLVAILKGGDFVKNEMGS